MAPSPTSPENRPADEPPRPVDRSTVSWKHRLLGTIVLSAIVMGMYAKSLRYEMIFDDISSIVENESVHQLWPLFGPEDGYGPLNPQPNTPLSVRPLVSLTMAINYHWGGENPIGYRLPHLLMHLLCGLLLWSIVSTTLRRPFFSEPIAKHASVLGFLSAVLWLVHPGHNETVVYLTQRTELMMGLFYLLTMYFSIRYLDSERFAHRLGWLCGAAMACIAGMLCKEMIASVPAMVLIYEWLFLSRRPLAILKRSWSLYFALMLSYLVIVGLYFAGYETPGGGFNNSISATDWWMTQANAFFLYWKVTFWPYPLVLHYYVPTLRDFATAWPGIIGLILYAILTVVLLCRRNPIGYSLIWFFAVLSPTLVIPLPREEVAERRLYVALAAISPVVVVGLFMIAQKAATFFNRDQATSAVSQDRLRQNPLLKVSQLVVAGLSIASILVSVTTMPRMQFQDTYVEEVLKHQPNHPYALNNQGITDFEAGRREKGLRRLKAAFELDPTFRPIVLSYANGLKEMGEFEEAIEIYQIAIRDRPPGIRPGEYAIHYELACTLDALGQTDEAMTHYRKAIELRPSHHASHTNLALMLTKQYRLEEAAIHFEAAVDAEPDFENCMNLMNIYVRLGDTKKQLYAARKLLDAARKDGKTETAERIEKALETLGKTSN